MRTGPGPDGWRLVPLGEGDVPVREMLRLLIAGGYGGWVSAEWEKHWHPEIAEPEIAPAAAPAGAAGLGGGTGGPAAGRPEGR